MINARPQTAIRVLIAIEPRAYSQTIGYTVRALRPRYAVGNVDPDLLGAEVECRAPDLVGLHGTVQKCWGHPDYAAVDIRLEDGRMELLWFHELDVVDESDVPSGANRYLPW